MKVAIKKARDLMENKRWQEASVLLKEQMSGIDFNDDAPPSDTLTLDGLLISASLACQQARLFKNDKFWEDRAFLLIDELTGDEKAQSKRIAKEENKATIARLELGLHPTKEEWL
jgi:hypothetical protein